MGIGIKFLKQLLLFISVFFIVSQNIDAKEIKEERNQIISTSLKQEKNHNQIILETKYFPKYRVFTLTSPLRLVIELQNIRRWNNKINFSENQFSRQFFGPAQNKRIGDDLQITFDLKEPIKVSKSNIINSGGAKKSYFLLIDLNKEKDEIEKNFAKKDQMEEKTDLEGIVENKDYGKGNDSKKIKYNLVSPLNNKVADQIMLEDSGNNYDQNQKTMAENLGAKNLIAKKDTKKIKLPVIVIDAGHGGKDPGTIGVFAHSKEKNITLAYALELKKQLDKSGKFKAFLTRDTDYFIPLRKRVEKARKLKVDLFISLHVNAIDNRKTKGLSIYTLSERSSDKQAELLAQKENKADIIGGVNFTDASNEVLKTLIALAQRDSMNNSAQFAQIAIKNFDQTGVEILQNSHRFAGFMVLTAPDVPSTLIELGYLSNKSEEKQLNSLSYRRKISAIIVNSIEEYFSQMQEYRNMIPKESD